MEPINISEVLNVNAIRPQPERGERVKGKGDRQMKGEKKGEEKEDRVALSIATHYCFLNISQSKLLERLLCIMTDKLFTLELENE